MYQPIEKRVREALAAFIRAKYSLDINVVTERPPQIEMGEIASPVCFELAKRLKRAPRQIAQEIASTIGKLDGVDRFEIAGAGYLNAYLDRSAFFRAASAAAGHESVAASINSPKAIVEHTNINPNKAAHIGHLRNAVLGDAFVRLLRYTGRRVEVQNYIDNTGVQVADVVLAFIHLEKKMAAEVRALAAQPQFDYLCWDLYARVTQFLDEDKSRLELRGETLKSIEHGSGDAAEMAEVVSTAIVRRHLETMSRLEIEYDLLPRESEILHLKFWDAAFQKLIERGAIQKAAAGKNAGCWVMPLPPEKESNEPGDSNDDADAKIIVRSNGTVTYVGKDIAYQLWKFGLLGKDFYYAPFLAYPDGRKLWITCSEGGSPDAPAFGRANEVFNVIDSRQTYPQQVVVAGLRALGFNAEADRSVHFSYEMVALTPRCAAEMGYQLSAEEAKKPYVEVSGRKGQGVKADDLLDQLEQRARAEVDVRHRDFSDNERAGVAHAIAIGALRYFLLKFTRATIIAFDFKDALSFEGETGPYVQYAVVRARNIFRKLREQEPEFPLERLEETADAATAQRLLAPPDGNDLWELLLLAGSLGAQVEAAAGTHEPAFIAKYAFQLAQQFNLFYHKHHILSEEDRAKKTFLLLLSALVEKQLVTALDLLGVEAPEKM
ncbi:MAG TPA: arginine--tRNA ligase [Candidatus Acidoferrales bacterium]|nr:arginine--tRNA ligase [Candidatus Acidoferrales bacterium]